MRGPAAGWALFGMLVTLAGTWACGPRRGAEGGDGFLDLVRPPDAVSVTTEEGTVELVRGGEVWRGGGLEVGAGVRDGRLVVELSAPGAAVKCVTVRWSVRPPAGEWKYLVDAWERWFLSLNQKDLPEAAIKTGKRTFRSLAIDGRDVEFSNGFSDLHTAVYCETLVGKGFALDDARHSVQLVHDIRHAVPVGLKGEYHPLAKGSLKS